MHRSWADPVEKPQVLGGLVLLRGCGTVALGRF